jgi:hypothetical protein
MRQPKPDEPATHVKNYITPNGLQRLKDCVLKLVHEGKIV